MDINKEKFIIQEFKTNYMEILDTIKPLIIYYFTTKPIKAYYLHKEYNPKNISKVILPPELTLEYNEVDINKVLETKYSESILKFVDVLIKNFPLEDLTNFYNNINTLSVKSKRFIQTLFLRAKVCGLYYSKKNKIAIDKDSQSTIYHELFHMASSTYKNGVSYSGFRINTYGKGLNEGYTELLTCRYFVLDYSSGTSYYFLKIIAEKLELIIGREKMQSLYLNSNLKGLIDELKQYVSEEEIIEFIFNTDFLVNNMDSSIQIFRKYVIVDCFKSINRFLITCYSKKMQQYSQNGKIIPDNELSDYLIKYISTMISMLNIDGFEFQIMTYQDAQIILQDSFAGTDVVVTLCRR